MKLTPHKSSRIRQATLAFTMVEVALSLAIIAFAIVAVIGILPTGMQVQKDNREETIINQDGQFLLEVIKNGQTNVNLLAQNLEWIESYTNTIQEAYPYPLVRSNLLNGNYATNQYAYWIVGLLSAPRFTIDTNAPSGYISNWVQAKFVANSGPLADRLTENPVTRTRDFAFSYLVTVDIAPVVLSSAASNANWEAAAVLQNNLYELRLTLSWPVYPNNSVGNGRKTFSSLVSGKLDRDTNGFYRFLPNEYNGLP